MKTVLRALFLILLASGTAQAQFFGGGGGSGGGGGGVTPTGTTITTGSSYSMQANDYVLIVNKTTGSATAITLPASPVTWATYTVADGKGDAGTNVITITPASGLISGSATAVLNNAYWALSFVWNGTAWSII